LSNSHGSLHLRQRHGYHDTHDTEAHGPHLVHAARQLGGADHPQTGTPTFARSHPLQRAALLGADRAAAASKLRPLISLPDPTHPLDAMTCTFSTEQIACLSAPLDRARVRQREQGRSKVSYLEGWLGDRRSQSDLRVRWLARPRQQ